MPLLLQIVSGPGFKTERAQNRTAWQTLVETATSLTSSGWWCWWWYSQGL